jgi:DNA-binding CsgD family transcriptional regulator
MNPTDLILDHDTTCGTHMADSCSQPASPIAVDPVLSARELEVLRLCDKGFSYDEVAALMALSRHTVLTFAKRIYRKLQVHSKTEALFEARRLGLVAL